MNRNILFSFILISICLSNVFGNPAYQLVDLGTTGDYKSYAYDINNSGEIIGYRTPRDGSGLRCVTWNKEGEIIDFDAISPTEIFAINDNSQIIGYSQNGYYKEGFIYDHGKVEKILHPDLYGHLPGGNVVPKDINDSGEVVGFASPAGDFTGTAFLYYDGSFSYLGSLGVRGSNARAINNLGQIAGYSTPYGALYPHAVLFEEGTIKDLGTLGGIDSRAHDINDNGQIVGDSYTDNDDSIHAFLYEDGEMKDIGTLGISSYATAINSEGVIVGGGMDNNRDYKALIWEGNELYDLNTLIQEGTGWDLKLATGINDLGQIIGYGTAPNGFEHAYLLNPVPEPATALLFLFGGLSIIRKNKAK